MTSGLISRTTILTVSRVSNFAVQLLSPLLLVRILDLQTFGQYQEFMIYAALLTTLCAFAVDSSITYFLPRYPDRERSLVTQTTVITLLVSLASLGALLAVKPAFLKLVNYDFVTPLVAYVFFFVNLNWLEFYWIAKRQPRLVLVYSAVRLIVRIGVLLVVAYVTRDVHAMMWSLVVVEAARMSLVLAYFSYQRFFGRGLQRSFIVEHLRFALPIGTAALVQHVGRSLGKIVISSTLGTGALAHYTVGSYLQPIVRVMRSGMVDAVFPELIRAQAIPGGTLRLWQRVNVLNCALLFPLSILSVYYAEEIIRILFTAAYLPAAPVFTIYAIFLIRRCFNTDVLLRTTGHSGFMLWGASGALILNLSFILLLTRPLGIIGPAIAFILAELALEFYYAARAHRQLQVRVADLADWNSIVRIAASCAIAFPILLGAWWLPGPDFIAVLAGSLLYVSATLLLAYLLGVADIGRVVGHFWAHLKRGGKN